MDLSLLLLLSLLSLLSQLLQLSHLSLLSLLLHRLIDMVRNHQDGYPYINLSLFCCCWKYTETSFFWKNWLVNEFRTAMGRGLLGILKKIISIFKTWQKMVTKFGQFKKRKWPFSSLQFCIYFLLKIYRIVIFLGKVYWSINSGPRWVWDC